MKTETSFNHMADRYAFDFGCCSFKAGFAQVDTGQDASYFGTWANPETLQIVSYVEGDITRQQAETPEEFATELRAIKTWNEENGHGFKGIDTMCVDAMTAKFTELGLADLFHGAIREAATA